DYAFYVTYHIDTLLHQGENVIGVMLGDGWYNQDVVWGGTLTYGSPKLWCQLDYKEGDKHLQVVSDQSWLWTNGAILSSNIYAGEVYDARQEIPGWASPGRPKGQWNPVALPERHPPVLTPQYLPPIKKMK